MGKTDRAMADYTRAINANHESAHAWYVRGLAYARAKQFDRALDDYAQALALSADNAGVWSARGTAHANLGQWDEALAAYSHVVRVDPTSATGWHHCGTLHRKLGHLDQALADFSHGIEKGANPVGLLRDRADLYHTLKLWDKELADRNLVLAADTKNERDWLNRGNVHHQLGHWQLALADFCHAVELKPKMGPALLSRANTCGAVGLWDKAIADLDLAAQVISPFYQPWVERAAYQLRNGNVDGYRNSCDRMRQLGVAGDPQRAARFALCWLLLPDAFSDARTAQIVARIAATGEPADPGCLLALGAAHYRAGNYQPAADQLDLALRQWAQPNDHGVVADGGAVIAWLFRDDRSPPRSDRVSAATARAGRPEHGPGYDRQRDWAPPPARPRLGHVPDPAPRGRGRAQADQITDGAFGVRRLDAALQNCVASVGHFQSPARL